MSANKDFPQSKQINESNSLCFHPIADDISNDYVLRFSERNMLRK